MGCGSSVNQMDNVSPPKQIKEDINLNNNKEIIGDTQIKPFQLIDDHSSKIEEAIGNKKEEERLTTAATVQSMKHEPMKHVPEGKAFIFGQSQNQRKILLFDCQKMQFSILSSKTQVPSTPNKYQPKDVIFQESQEMLASNLFNKNSHPPYNFMFITFINDDTIFLCGGVNFAFQYFSQQAFFFRASSIANEQTQNRRKKGGNNLVGNKFQKLPCMKQKRYSHMGIYFKTGRLGYIYVFGGRDQEDQLLSSCQQYSIDLEKWRDITPMKTPRSTGFSFIFKNKIYICGGYTGDKKRSKNIQMYDPIKNYWECLNVKLHRGIQTGLIYSLRPNQILLMGGNMQSGPLKSIIKINLAQQTYIWDSNMKNDRLLQKGVKYNESIFVFGGDFQDNFEKYTIKDRKWKDMQFSYSQFISVDDINSYQMATQTLQVAFDQSIILKNQQNAVADFQRFHIFGNDNFPCILEFNLNKWILKKKNVPMALRLRSKMGVFKVQQGKYFLCGGIDSLQQKASRASYIYYAGTNKAIQINKMKSKKYDFSICGSAKYVYIFGGKNQSGQILNQCQKYSFEEEKWITLPNLPNQRAGAKALLIEDKILLIGGKDTLQNINSIDIFDISSQTFWNPKQYLSMPAQIKSVYLSPKHMPNICPSIYIFSYNQILNKYFCHYLKLQIPLKNVQLMAEMKIEEDFQIVKDVQQKQINLKIIPFSHSFEYNNNFYIITSKGVFNWNCTMQQNKTFQSQIVINQVEMLQFPIDRFSSP